MEWLDSWPRWLYWGFMTSWILLGNGVFWVLLLRGSGVYLTVPPWLIRAEEGWFVAMVKFTLAIMAVGVVMVALLVAYFVPALFYQFVLGWPIERALPIGVVTPLVLFGIWLLGLVWWQSRGPGKVERWVGSLLAMPVEELNRRYGGTEKNEARIELEAMSERGKSSAAVVEQRLRELHPKLRGQECEWAVWEALIFAVEPLPDEIAHDLIDRGVAVKPLGLTRQSDAVMWRLAPLVEEALMGLFLELYSSTEREHPVAELEKLLGQFPGHMKLLYKWEWWKFNGASREKRLAYHRWAWRHEAKGEEVPSPEQFLVMMEEWDNRATGMWGRSHR